MPDSESKIERERILESKRLARCRTLEMVAQGKIASLADDNPQRVALQRKMREASSTLRAQERTHAERS
jgi:hypothetical protein